MRISVFCLLLSACLPAAAFDSLVKGSVVDPSGAPLAGAQVSVVTKLGVAETLITPDGDFQIQAPANAKLVITAPGFAAASIPVEQAGPDLRVTMRLAPQVDSVRVIGSMIDVSASEQGGSVTIIPREEIRQRNEALAYELLRYTPGVTINQTGPTGSLSGLYIRGGEAKFNLVQVDGVPVNSFGGNFDFSYIPSEAVERVEVIRGPQSAIYGPYANAGVVNFVTREPGQGLNLDMVAEGGTYRERRFSASGGGSVRGFGIAASASQMNTDGPVENSDYRNQNLMASVRRRFGRQSLALHGNFNSNENGVPGAWGRDPAGTFTGLDLISRNKNNFSNYSARYQADILETVRQEAYASYFQNNNGFISPYGYALNQDMRAQAETRTIISAARHYVAAVGVTAAVERIENSYITNEQFETFPIRRRDTAVYMENRFEFGGRLFINAGLRGEFLHTGAIPANGYSRPLFPAKTYSTANPKIAVAYAMPRGRLHASFGTGIRPPAGFDLAFTDNPALKPERTRSFEAGVERRFLTDRLALDATYFYNRFHDLMVNLGGSLAELSRYQSDNLANSRAYGAEFSARLRPARWVFVQASYTRLNTEILSLDGSSGVAQAPYRPGQELTRRPQDSGSLTASFSRGRLNGNVTCQARGATLDVEPSYGAAYGLFRNPGYAIAGLNLNYSVARGATVYGSLRNAFNRHYEEALGFPAPRLNFVTGIRWSLLAGR